MLFTLPLVGVWSIVISSICVCLCVSAHISQNFTYQILQKFSVNFTCGCGSVLLWWWCNNTFMYFWSSFVDDIMFSWNGANESESSTMLFLLSSQVEVVALVGQHTTLRLVEFDRWRHWEQSCCPWLQARLIICLHYGLFYAEHFSACRLVLHQFMMSSSWSLHRWVQASLQSREPSLCRQF